MRQLFLRIAQGAHINVFQEIYGSMLAYGLTGLGIVLMSWRLGWKVIVLFTPVIFAIIAMILISQPVSVYRATTFAGVFLVLPVGVAISTLITYLGFTISRRIVLIVLFGIAFGSAMFSVGFFQDMARLGNYAIGRVSPDDYYREFAFSQSVANPTTLAVDLKKRFGADVRVTTLSLVSNQLGRAYLIGTGVKSEVSYAFGREWADIVFGPPDEAFKMLKSKTDFLILNKRWIGISTIAFSHLLEPGVMSKYFKVIARDGDWVALVPKDSELQGEELLQSDLDEWAHARATSLYRDLANSMSEIYQFNGGHIDHRPALPPGFVRPKGWQ
jgi:hypothetical protein